MGIYIDNIEMPKGHGYLTVNIWSSGVASYGLFNREGNLCTFKGAKAISVPSHGDLIDVQEQMRLMQSCEYDTYDDYIRAFDMLDNAPTVIPADPTEEGET